MNYKSFFLFILSSISICSTVFSQSPLVFEQGGRLNYTEDSRGNKVPDFSAVGYMNGEVEIPTFPIVITLDPVNGDNLNHIQSAINNLEAMSPNINGVRGAILLKRGEYLVSNTIYVRESGISLIGEGADDNGTILRATRTEQHDLLVFDGDDDASVENNTGEDILDNYLPIGATRITLGNVSGFNVGDLIMLRRTPKQSWLTLLGTDRLSETDPGDSDWTVSGYTYDYKRKIVSIEGNQIIMDCPVVDPIDEQYATGEIFKYTWDEGINNVGVENIKFVSDYASDEDENHGWTAVTFNNTEHGWVTNIEGHHFGYGTIDIDNSSSNITVENSKNIDPKSRTAGGRKYSFNVNGQRNLIKNCYSWGGRHDFVTGGRVLGPNVFLNCEAENMKGDIGPHHRWATGVLFDNVVGDDEMNARNRLNSGSGHGWAGSQIMFWNCTATDFRVEDPPVDHINWCVGCIGNVTGDGGYSSEDIGYVESQNEFVSPQSLYEQQLIDRLNNVVTSNNELTEELKQRELIVKNNISNSDFILKKAFPNDVNVIITSISGEIIKDFILTSNTEVKIGNRWNKGTYIAYFSYDNVSFSQRLIKI